MIKIDKNKEVTSRLPFLPFPQFDNLGLGYLIGVRVTETVSKEDAKWEFKGMTVPLLAFDFIQHKLKSDEKDRFMTMSFGMISNELADGTERKESKVETSYYQMWDKIKHLHNQYEGDNWMPIATEPTFKPEGTIEERIIEFKAFFEGIAKDFLVGKDKSTPIYKVKDLLGVVLVASGKKLSYHSVPDFAGKGIFDRVSISEKGKLITTLVMPPNATIKLGESQPQGNPQGGAAGTDDVPEELKQYMNT